MKDVISKAIALGLGIGVASKRQVEKIASEVQKKAGVSKKDSQKLIKNMIKEGERVRKNLDIEVTKIVDKAVEKVCTVSINELEALKAKTVKKKTAKKAAKKSKKKAAKKTAKKRTKKATRKTN